MNGSDEMMTGTVRTDAYGSEVTFDICTRAEWEQMDEEQQHAELVGAMWESGRMEVYANLAQPKRAGDSC